MKKELLSILLLGGMGLTAGAQQLSNTTFDGTWENCYPWEKGAKVSTKYGTQPSGWCVSNVPNSSMPLVASEVSGVGGGKAVKLSNVSVLGQSAPGYMTLGTTWATAETRLTTVRNADGGVFGGISFTYRPDAVRMKYQHDISNGAERMSVIAYLWKGTWTQASVPSNTAVGVFSYGSATKVTMTDRINNILGKSTLTGGAVTKTADAALIASVEHYIPAAASDWTDLTVELDYGSYAGQEVTPEKLNIVIAVNDLFADRSGIKSGNSVLVDDVELVYWHALSDLKVNGTTLPGFAEGTLAYEVEGDYQAGTVTYTKKGQAAQVSESYNSDTRTLSLTVRNADNGGETVYTILYKKQSQSEVKTYSEPLYVTINGETTPKQMAAVDVETLAGGNINFALKNFILSVETESLYVGNIAVSDIAVESDGTFAYTGSITISKGDTPAGADWMGPDLGNVPLELKGRFVGEDHVLVSIDIDMMSVMGQIINVHLGYDRATLAVSSAKYGTFVAPFAVEIPSGVQAYTVGSVVNTVLTLTNLTGTIPANTPVVVESEAETSTDFFGQANAVALPQVGLLTGVYAATAAPVGSYVLQNQSGTVGFYPVVGTQPTVKANRCYLTAPSGSAGIKAFYLDQATGLSALEAIAEGKAEIHDLQGRRHNTLQRGINIVNGQKILVK